MFESLLNKVKALFAKVRLPKLTLKKFSLPKITLPKLSLPKLPKFELSLPKVSLPKLTLPKFSLPRLNLSPVVTALKAVWAFLVRGMSKFLGHWRFLLIAVLIVSAVGLGSFAVGQQQLTMESLKFTSAPTTTMMEVTGNKVNVRPCPGTNCQAVGSLHGGDVVEVLERVTADNGDEWCKISFKDADAYVACKFLEVKGE